LENAARLAKNDLKSPNINKKIKQGLRLSMDETEIEQALSIDMSPKLQRFKGNMTSTESSSSPSKE